ncbi:MAG: heparan-alpha-glucosaminide N-acetyltransferase domain-containing protein, partial [Candidatus Helarchaeota archaeon]
MNNQNSKKFRLNSLDVTRGFAIICMITFHFITWWIDPYLDYDLMIFFQITGHLAAPLFLMILGMSQVFSLHFRKLNGHSDKEIQIHMVKRLAWFFLISTIMNLFLEFNYLQDNLLTIFTWEIFQILLFTTLILYLIRKVSIPVRIALIIIIYFLNILIRNLLNVSFLGIFCELEFNSLQNIVRGLLFNGLFSPLPYLIYGILGSILADFYLSIRENKIKIDDFWKYILISGGIIMITSVFIETPPLYTSMWGTTFIWLVRETYSATLFNIGFSLLVFGLFYLIIETKNVNN